MSPGGRRARAAGLRVFLRGRKMTCGQAERGLGVPPNSLRYAATTGTIVIRWDGARQPTIWTVPPPGVSRAQHGAVEAEAAGLPLPGIPGPLVVRWDG